MSSQQSQDAAARERIAKHMNTDHHDSVTRYLQHYHHLSSVTAYDGKITNVSLSQLEISCAGRPYVTPFDPPMKNYREARERLVEMDKTCREALGVSDIAVRRWSAPEGLTLGVWCMTAVIIVVFSRRANLETSLAYMLPEWFRAFCWRAQPFVFWFIALAHSLEMVVMARGRLVKHSVNPRSIVYWQWLGDVAVVGFGAFLRFDELVRTLKDEKASRGH